jgi:hypothetical protein
MQPRHSPVVFAALLLLAAATPQQDKVFSGPQPGEKAPPFKVLQVFGPQAGKEVELAGESKGGPALLVFVHELTRPAMQLLRPLDLYASKVAGDGLDTHFVWLAADRTLTEEFLGRARQSLNLQSPINISLDGIEGPGSYGLNRKVALTILIVKEQQVVANFAITQPNETDAPPILAEMAKLVGKTPPTLAELGADRANMRRDTARPTPARPTDVARPAADAAEAVKRLEDEVARLKSLDQEHHARALARVAELEKRVAELADALNDARTKIAKLEGSPAPEPIKKPSPRVEPVPAARKDEPRKDEPRKDVPRRDEPRKDEPRKKAGADLPGRTPMDPEIIGLMRRMIQSTNDEATVKEINDAMLKWAGDDKQRKDDLKQFAVRIAHLGYGGEPAKAAIKKLAGTE